MHLYGYLNINAEEGGEDQHNASHESGFVHEEEDAHVTLTTVHDKTGGPLKRSSVSSDFTSKILNLDDPSLNINSLMDTLTVPPPLPPVNPSSHLITIPQQQTPDSMTTITDPTITFLEIPNFVSLFQFDQRIKEEVNVTVWLQSNKLREEAQVENQEFLNQVDATMKAIIKEQILIEKMETNNSINISDIQKNLYNSLVEAYKSDTNIITSYGDVVTLKRGRDDQEKDEDPSARSDRCTQSQPKSSGKSTKADEPIFETAYTEMQYDQENEFGYPDYQPDNEATPKHDCKPLPLIKDRGCQVVAAEYFINNDLDYLKGGSSCSKYATSTTRTMAAKKRITGVQRQRFYAYACHCKSPHDVYSKRKFITVTSVKVMRWYDYRYLEEIVVQRDDNVLYKFKEGDFPKLNLCDIKDMLLLLVQKKLSNLDVDAWYDLGVALQMFTRRIIILHHVEDLQLGVESYQKKLNIPRLETFRSDIPNLIPYSSYKNP
uniref:Uncharacterized protein n=1 Tax=Tanacetum cinerariifolium TaxID=118510 RepID=A0A6L2MSS7_TANCI|nr:hypothetical protein [Tanacetum cinerariifolium]